jgi:hypothetical protein
MASRVYFIKAAVKDGAGAISAKARKLFKAGGFAECFREEDFTAVKVHVGEGPNTTYIKAKYIKGLADELLKLKTNPFATDTSTLYTGRRHNAVDHAILADEHGFNVDTIGIPFIVCDGLFGTAETPVRIDGPLNKEVLIASDICRAQSLLSVAHFTGHLAVCPAATIKTLGMGCATRKGKMRQHSSTKPSISKECTLCGECYKHCPVKAITLGDTQAHIDQDKCIGCAECVAVCRFEAVEHDWGAELEQLQRNVAEHALGVMKGKEGRAVFFNYVISVTPDCDCFDTANMRKIVPDIGIMASTDPVAVDRAAVDLVEKTGGKKFAKLARNAKLNPEPQLQHAECIGLGSNDYELIEVK